MGFWILGEGKLLINDVDGMNEFMNKIALHSFSSFDIAKNASDDDAPERFYHGFVLGLMVELAGRFGITFADGFSPERIRKYEFAFRGKECLISMIFCMLLRFVQRRCPHNPAYRISSSTSER